MDEKKCFLKVICKEKVVEILLIDFDYKTKTRFHSWIVYINLCFLWYLFGQQAQVSGRFRLQFGSVVYFEEISFSAVFFVRNLLLRLLRTFLRSLLFNSSEEFCLGLVGCERRKTTNKKNTVLPHKCW